MKLGIGSVLDVPAPVPVPAVSIANISPMFAFGNTNATPLATRTIDRSLFGSPAAGEILVAMQGRAGYLGESLQSLRTPTFQIWSNQISGVQQTASDTGEFTAAMWIREASGDSEDTCVMFSNGPFPSCCQVVRMAGNVFTFPGTITADNENDEDLADASGIIHEGDMFGGFNDCMEFFCSTKRATAAQSLNGATAAPGAMTLLGTADSIDNGFDQGMVAAWGWHYSFDAADRLPIGDFGGATYNEAAFAVGARWKTGAS